MQQAGFVQTTANPANIVTSSGTNVTGRLFGNFQMISINGTKFQDTNGNGAQNAGELGLSGWTIFLDADNDGVLDIGERSTTTDANGNYSFTNVGPGTFTVREVQQAGFVQTTANPANIGSLSGTNVAGVTFGNFQLFSINGTKFRDTNGNGVLNVGETGLAGVTIFLDANNNGVLDPTEKRTTTDANGNYSFANLGPGTYIVREVQQAGFVQTTVNPANIASLSGTNVFGVVFGNQSVSIGGTKFRDTNGNGIRDGGEQGLAGWTIYLDANNNGVLDVGEIRTTTTANGSFGFTNLAPGTYHVREVGQAGFVQMTNNPADIVLTTGGATVTTIVFGNMPVDTLVTVSKLLFTGQNLTNLLNGTFALQANYVASLYQTLLHHAPDLAGLTYYLRLLMAGYNQQQVSEIFQVDHHLLPI